MRKEELQKKLAELKKELNNVKGTPTEIYSRVVGYYRPVQQWNDGKQEEFKDRKVFKTVIKQTATV